MQNEGPMVVSGPGGKRPRNNSPAAGPGQGQRPMQGVGSYANDVDLIKLKIMLLYKMRAVQVSRASFCMAIEAVHSACRN